MIGKKINQLATELAPASTDLTIIGNPTTGVSKKITLAQLGAIFSGAVSFYTNLASFPATGTLDVIFCAKDTQKLYLWSGSAYVEVFPSQALLDTYQLRSEKGVSNGYASLDSSGKVPISQLPSSIMEYKGTWNAATNTPTLANGTGDTGDVYICNVAGTVDFGAGAITFAVGDYVIYSGTIWQRSSGAVGTVTSVAASITGNSIGITGSPVTTSGTLAFAFAGTGTQYIKGDGTLATFPSTIAQAERLITEVYNSTGATLTKGTIVYINGGQGNLPTVTKALATGDSTSAQTFGVVQADITNNNNGYVVVAGKLSDLDTQAYTEGTQLYLSATTAGTWTSTKQYAPAHLVYVGIVVRAHPTQGIVEIKIQNGYELDEIHNVAAQTPTNNDGLFWESSTSLWKNKSIATVLGYTPQPQLSGTGFVKISGTTISYDNSTYLTTSAAATTYLPMVLSSTANSVDINGQQFSIYGSAGGFTSGRIIVDPVFSAIGYQVSGVFNGLKILTNGNADFTNSGITRFFNQVRFDSTLTDGTYTYTLPSATGTIALVGGAGVGTVTSVGLSSATSGVTIGSTPVTTSGTITLAIATASGSQQGLLSSTDWTTFNNKQNALTNPVTGTGTTNYLPKFTGTSSIGNSAVQDDGTNILTSLAYKSTANSNTFGNASLSGRALIIQSGSANQAIMFKNAAGGDATLYVTGTSTSVNYQFDTYSVGGALTLTNSGNLGLGVSPSAWNGRTAIQLPDAAYIVSSGASILLGANVYFDGANRTYISNAVATDYRQVNGEHRWEVAPSGTAGNAISFTQAMTLNASGNLSIGNTNDTYKLDVSGTGRFSGAFTVSNGDAKFYSAGTSLWWGANGGTDYGQLNWNTGEAIIAATTGNQLTFRTGGVTSAQNRLVIASTGAATFSSSVTAVGLASTGTNHIYNSNELRLYNSNNTNWGTIKGSTDTTNGTISLTGGTGNGIFITNGGSVGIGTTSPTANLQVYQAGTAGNNYVEGTIQVGGTSSTLGGAFSYAAQSSGYVNITNLNNGGGANARISFGFGAITSGLPANNVMTLNQSGNVGIGTTSPLYKFEVSDGTRTGVFNPNSSLDGFFIGTYQAKPLIFGTGDAERMRITSNGGLNVGTTTGNSITKLNVQADATRFIAFEAISAGGNKSVYIRPVDSGIHLISSNYITGSPYLPLALSARENNADLYLSTGGNVGIGTTSPSTKLHIVDTNPLVVGDSSGSLTVTYETGTTAVGQGGGMFLGIPASSGSFFSTYIKAARESSDSSNSAASLVFGTRTNGGSNTERMRITSGGIVSIGTTNTYYSNNLIVSAGSEGGITIANPGTTGAQYIMFADGTTGADRYRGYMTYNHTDNSLSFATDANIRLTIASTGAATFSSTIQTGAPTNGTAQPWRLGNAVSGSISTDSYIIVSVNGSTYSIPALNGLP